MTTTLYERASGADRQRERTLRLEAVMKGIALGPGRVGPRRYLPARDGTWDAYDFVIGPAFDAVARALPHRVRRDDAALRSPRSRWARRWGWGS